MDIYDQAFMQKMKLGDRLLFEQLFRDLYVRLCVYAESMVRDRHMAEDIVQNVFCTLWEKRVELSVSESLKSYLYRSVYNAAMNSLKHEKVKLAFFQFVQRNADLDEEEIEQLCDKDGRERLIGEINKAVENLPCQCRDIFLLSRFSGKKSSEIATELDISVRTVETQLYRALKRLREDLAYLKNSEILFLYFFPKYFI